MGKEDEMSAFVEVLLWDAEVEDALERGFTYDNDEDAYIRDTYEVVS